MPLYECLDRIEARPGMYLSQPGFQSLRAFIHGYEEALRSNRIPDESTPPFAGFRDFVVMQLAHKASIADGVLGGPSWEAAIEDAARSDQERLDLFFRLLNQFRESKAAA